MGSFGIVFVGKSFPIDCRAFAQSSPTHWVLDVAKTVDPYYAALKEVCLFLSAPNALPPQAGLGLYVSVGGQDWQYRGCVSNARPSDAFPVRWPTGEAAVAGCSAQIGVSVESLADLEQKEGCRLGQKEEFAKRVALNLFQFLESFSTGHGVTPAMATGTDYLVVPANFLDKWFQKFQAKFRRDPDFLTRDAAPV